MIKYYFSYGSNLCRAQMLKRCPNAKSVGVIKIHNMRTIFRRFADIEPSNYRCVTGAIWQITEACEQALDHYEEIQKGLYRKDYISLRMTLEGKEQDISPLVYIMNCKTYALPSEDYLATIRQGYRDFGLDPIILTQALEDTAAKCSD